VKRFLFVLVLLWPALAWAQAWPDPNAYWVIKPTKVSGMEMTDDRWAHLHLNSPDATSVGFKVVIDHLGNEVFTDFAGSQLQIRYVAHGVLLSGWLTTPPYLFVLDFTNGGVASLTDGIHDLTVEVQAVAGSGTVGRPTIASKQDFRPYPMFLHIGGRSTPSTSVPILSQNEQDARVEATNSSGDYVDASTLVPTGYPAATTVTPWSGLPPYNQNLVLEQLQPHSREFAGVQMLWEEPPGTVNAGLRFIRSFPPKFGESFLGLWNNNDQIATNAFGFSGHRSFPVKDGARGIGWTNGYVQGVVESTGILWMVNISGQLRIMKPDGELITVVGWRVRSDKQPVWYLKPLTSIRTNMEFRGSFVSGGWPDAIDPGWHQPMDVALDPNDNTKVYVAGLYDNAIYRVDVNRTTWVGTVTLIAGDVNHAAGYVDATGDQARFNHPFSLVASNDGTKLYVSDHDNDAIRVVTLATGAVTTLERSTGLSAALQAAGVSCATDIRLACWPASAVRPRVHVTVTAPEAAGGTRPDIYFPYWIRISSTGKLVLFDRGMNSLRVIDPATHVTTLIDQLGDGGFDGNFQRGWVWGDVDKTGNAGAVDGIVWGSGVSISPPPLGETEDRFNENYRYTSLDGTVHSWVFGPSRLYHPEDVGGVSIAQPPHYPWLMAFDPRGALIVGGMGDHGLVRLRLRKSGDPTIPDDLVHLDARRVWESGAPSPLGFYYTITANTTNTVVNAPATRYGWGGHNLIGLADTWQLTPTTTDGAIDSLFGLSTAITSNAGAHAAVLAFLRAFSETTPIPPPPDATPPTVSVTAPAAGTVSGIVPVTATAADNVGVVGVQFLLDDLILQAEDGASPYAIAWDTTAAVPNGAHVLKARARDAAGNVTTSAGVSVTVSNTAADTTAPAVSVTAPTGTFGGTQSVTATASDNVAVVGVQFKLDGLLLGAEDTTAPYAVSWDTIGSTNGAHVLTAVARDAAGNTTTSAADNVTVSNASADVTAPTVSVTTSPATVVGTVTLDATASDAVGVVGVQFKVDGAVLNAEDLTAPYSTSWDTTTVSNASHTITALARDAAGNTTTSAGVAFTVNNPAVPPPPVDIIPPVIAFTTPTNGQTVTGTVTLVAPATDAGGVASVQFFVDGDPLGPPDTVAPYATTWTSVGGSHVLSAKAIDLTGNVASTTVTVLVVVPNPPDVCTLDPLIVRVTQWPSGNANQPTNQLSYRSNKRTVSVDFVQTPREAVFTDIRGCVVHVR
jgi:YD repeat-containing protein